MSKEVKCPSCDRELYEFCLCDQKPCPMEVYKKYAELKNQERKQVIDKVKKNLRDISVPIPVSIPPSPIPFMPTSPPTPWANPSRCARCGMLTENMTHYYCNRSDCPTFLKVTC